MIGKRINIRHLSLATILVLSTKLFAQDEVISLDTISVIENNSNVTQGTDSYTTDYMNTSTKLDLSIKDTPQTITVITSKEIEDKNITSYKDVLSNIAGVTLNNRGTNVVSAARGFDITYYKVDGSPSYSTTSQNDFDMAIYDRVEVVKGANGLMTGQGDPSLSINFIRKHANSKEFQGSLTLDAGSWDSYSQTIDMSTPLSQDKKVRGRVVLKNENSKKFYDNFDKDNTLFYGIVDADLSDETSVSIGTFYDNMYRGGAWFWALPAFYSDGTRTDFPRSTSLTKDWAYWDMETKEVFGNVKHYIYDDITFNLSSSFRRIYERTHTLRFTGSLNKVNGSGMNVSQYADHVTYDEMNLDSYFDVPFNILNLSQEIIAGGTYNKSKDSDEYKQAFESVSNLFDYDGKALLENTAYTSGYPEETEQIGIYLVGRFSLTQRLNLITGARLSTWKYHSDDISEEDREFKNELTPYAGLVYELDDNHSLFVSYTDIFKTQRVKDINEKYLDPIVGKNYETGIKGEYFDGKLNTSFSLFKIIQDNVAQVIDGVTLSDGSNAYEAKKGVESKGYEVSLAGELTDKLDTTFSLAKFEAKDAKDEKVNTKQSRATANLFTNYKLNKDLDVGAGLKYYSKYYTGTGTSYIEQKAYFLTNAMMKYKLNKSTSVQLNVNNLLDKKYYEGIGNYWMVYGEPRNFNVSVKYSF
ncbi:TonB-dependent ferric coprogen/ferric-rhodotorulic acid receptor [Arcobacter venerupis]|uniref:TonB-dependent ferric coprogen/ferric-rhodotorulic acid receptor n=1 Tax=Arcobacter venerupis TaxID=1054033 RepID=A0AAE7E455_9BACT|nr:TonB-dependent siderophore receptor [Arcobacter venerupis]QKF66652.1 TonB-dependent ferric coprogen/ferric-rhodotorulic acid receptor [Arcobacter venerupis]RWS49617.1 hypothetical protein CKA56_07795 [Arcobacter venerupis]